MYHLLLFLLEMNIDNFHVREDGNSNLSTAQLVNILKQCMARPMYPHVRKRGRRYFLITSPRGGYVVTWRDNVTGQNKEPGKQRQSLKNTRDFPPGKVEVGGREWVYKWALQRKKRRVCRRERVSDIWKPNWAAQIQSHLTISNPSCRFLPAVRSPS